jgi:hypothetical protein
MDLPGLMQKLQHQMESGEVNWREAREGIYSAHENATDEAERVLCLRLHKAVFDAVERDGNAIAPGGLADFRKTRKSDYNLLLVKEAMIGRTDERIDPTAMRRITEREVRAGRMSADDELHKLSVAGAEVLGAQPESKKSAGVLSTIRSWFR